jgi:transposase
MDGCPRKSYPTDLTDEQWALVEAILLAFEERIRPGPERSVDLREVINTLLYQNCTGCQWAFLPHDLLPKSTAYDHFTKWRDHGLFQPIVDALRSHVRQQTPLEECFASRSPVVGLQGPPSVAFREGRNATEGGPYSWITGDGLTIQSSSFPCRMTSRKRSARRPHRVSHPSRHR